MLLETLRTGLVMKFKTNFTALKGCFYRLRSPLLPNISVRGFHLSAANDHRIKLKENRNSDRIDVFFTRNESMFYHRTLENDPKYAKTVLKPTYFSNLLDNTPDTKLRLDDDLTKLSPNSVLPFTATITRQLLDKKVDFSSPELLQFAAYMKKNSKHVPREDIPKILSLMYLWPTTNKLLHGSINSIIFALDSACGAQAVFSKNAPVEEILLLMEPWHWLGLCTMSEFVQMATGKLFWRADKTEHIVQLLFYMSELRTLPNHYDRPSIEKKVIRFLRYFNNNEVGILAAGFYKSSTKVTNYVLYKQLVKRVVNDAHRFEDIPLNAVLKLLRSTILSFKEEKDVIAMQKSLLQLVPSLSGMCLVQAAMLGTPMEIIDQELMRNILSILCRQSMTLREKDLQRVMYACAMGMDETDMREFVEHVVDEVYKRNLPTLHHVEDARNNPEVYTKLVSFIEIVLFLHILGHRSSELLASAIEIGKCIAVHPKQTVALHHLDVIADLLYPDYSGPRIDELVREKHHKVCFPGKSTLHPTVHWFSYEWRNTTSEMLRTLYLDVCDACGGIDYVSCQSLLPLYEHKDLVVCTDEAGNFVPIPGEFGSEPSWQAKAPISTGGSYYVLMLLRDRSKDGLPDYTLYQKLRETLLRKLGYRIAILRYRVFEDIPREEKHAYIREAIAAAEK